MQNEKAEALLSCIQAAFAETQYPGDDCLGRSENWEASEVTQWLKGKKWQDLNATSFAKYGSDLWFMTLEAYIYYLPACMIAMINGCAPGNLQRDVLMSLTSPDGFAGYSFTEIVNGFAPEQKKALALFLCDEAEQVDEFAKETIKILRKRRRAKNKKKRGSKRHKDTPRKYTPRNPARSALESYWGQFLD